jgi:hypothetical protein
VGEDITTMHGEHGAGIIVVRSEEREFAMTNNLEADLLEGTWEELLAHSDRFAGRRFRLLPLDTPESGAGDPVYSKGETLDKVLASFLAETAALPLDAEDVQELNRSDPLKHEIRELVAAKFRRQGFDA